MGVLLKGSIPVEAGNETSGTGKPSVEDCSAGCLRRARLTKVLMVTLFVLTVTGTVDHSYAGSTVKNLVWRDVNGKALPFQTNEAIEAFLLEAEVLSLEELPEGVTDPKKVVLDRDGVRVHAVFRDVEVQMQRGPGRKGKTMLNFRDSCLFESAAYELSKLLGINNVPPTVRRKVRGDRGTVQIFIENGLMEKERLKQKKQPTNQWRWMMHKQVLMIFDNLIHNDDRNAGNVVYDEDWNLWMIDHTRAFRAFRDLPDPKRIQACESGLWERLQALEDETLSSSLQELLRPAEIKGLLERRKKLVKYISALISKNGEKKVLFTFY